MAGTTIGTMMMNESIRSVDVPSPTTPLGWRTISCWHPASAGRASMAPQRTATAYGDRPLNRGCRLNALPANDRSGLVILRSSDQCEREGCQEDGIEVHGQYLLQLR